jgi:hypothetical protein
MTILTDEQIEDTRKGFATYGLQEVRQEKPKVKERRKSQTN